MKNLLFFLPCGCALIAFAVLIVAGVWWQKCVSLLLRKTPEANKWSRAMYARLNIWMLKNLQLAENVDAALARKMRKIFALQIVAFCVMMICGLLALLGGGVVFGP